MCSTTYKITPHEQRIIDRIKQGKMSKEIAYELGLTLETVKTYTVKLLDKFEVRNRTELAGMFIQLDLLGMVMETLQELQEQLQIPSN